jgi:hypothetical protein
MTFTLGLASVMFFDNKFLEDSKTIEKTELETTAVVTEQLKFKRISEMSDSKRLVVIYKTLDGQEILSGNFYSLNVKGMKRRIRQAKRIIERKNGRFILEFKDKQGHYYEILQHVIDDSYDFIRAPTLELALEFEEETRCKGG